MSPLKVVLFDTFKFPLKLASPNKCKLLLNLLFPLTSKLYDGLGCPIPTLALLNAKLPPPFATKEIPFDVICNVLHAIAGDKQAICPKLVLLL